MEEKKVDFQGVPLVSLSQFLALLRKEHLIILAPKSVMNSGQKIWYKEKNNEIKTFSNTQIVKL